MSEFDGLRKHEKTQHALKGLGSSALAADIALRERNNSVKNKQITDIIISLVSCDFATVHFEVLNVCCCCMIISIFLIIIYDAECSLNTNRPFSFNIYIQADFVILVTLSLVFYIFEFDSHAL